MRLSEYLTGTSVLLGDTTFSFNSKFMVTQWVNEARRLASMRTGCIRRLLSGQSAFGALAQPGFAIPGAMQPNAVPGAFPYGTGGPSPTNGAGASPQAGAALGPLMTIPQVERYPFEGFFNPYLKQQHKGCRAINDIISVANSWGGVSKPTLDWMPWDEFQAYCRAYSLLNTAYPSVWSVMNDGTMGELWLFPIPSQANDLELDVTCLPQALYTDDDYDAVPESFSDSIKFGAAALGFLATRRAAEAEVMNQQGGGYFLTMRAAADKGKSRSYYTSY